MKIEDELRKLVRPYGEIRCGAYQLWVGSKWQLTPYQMAMLPVHRHSGDIYAGTTPFTLLKDPDWTPGMELINDWHKDIAGFLWCMQDLPEEWFDAYLNGTDPPMVDGLEPNQFGGVFNEFLHWWNRLAGGSSGVYHCLRWLYQSEKVWKSLSLAHRSVLWIWINRVRFTGQWHGLNKRDPGIYVGNWRIERKEGGSKVSNQCGAVTCKVSGTRSHPQGDRDSSWERFRRRLCRPNVEVCCEDALELIKKFNVPGMLWNIDPPYWQAPDLYPDQHPITEEQSSRLLGELESLKGFFFLWVRPWPELDELAERERWLAIPTAQKSALGKIDEEKKEFGEVLMMNFSPWEVERCCDIPLPAPLSQPAQLF